MQTKRHSVSEALTSTFVGLLVGFFAQILICRLSGIPLKLSDNVIIVFWMTVVSVIRGYLIRRYFNWRQHGRSTEGR